MNPEHIKVLKPIKFDLAIQLHKTAFRDNTSDVIEFGKLRIPLDTKGDDGCDLYDELFTVTRHPGDPEKIIFRSPRSSDGGAVLLEHGDYVIRQCAWAVDPEGKEEDESQVMTFMVPGSAVGENSRQLVALDTHGDGAAELSDDDLLEVGLVRRDGVFRLHQDPNSKRATTDQIFECVKGDLTSRMASMLSSGNEEMAGILTQNISKEYGAGKGEELIAQAKALLESAETATRALDELGEAEDSAEPVESVKSGDDHPDDGGGVVVGSFGSGTGDGDGEDQGRSE